ncbi:MAG TPA: hypothetical protein VN043_15710 [Rhodanobacter sp.]|nr:hypothetical protein [Rhodanobacter sp.]
MMALLACLLYVTMTAIASAMPMTTQAMIQDGAGTTHRSGAEQVLHQHAAHGSADLPSSGCGDAEGSACHCAAMSAGMLPIIAVTSLAPMHRPRFGLPPHIAAPAPARAAPLRPPQA